MKKMNSEALIVIFLLTMVSCDLRSQTLCDTTSHDGEVELFVVSENMPVPNLTANDMEDILNNSVQPTNYSNLPEKIPITFIINCKGETFDYKFHVELDKDLQNKIEILLKTKLVWTPGLHKGFPVDFSKSLMIKVQNSQFSIQNFESQNNKKKKKKK